VTLDLAVIIVSWNVQSLVLDTLRTLDADLKTSDLKAAIWVLDNASTDGTVEAIRATFPAVHLIARSDNLGFAGGNNAAMRELGFCDVPTPNPSGPRAVFLLNPDTLVKPGAIRALYDGLLGLPKAGMVGAQLFYEDGSFQHGAFGFPGLAQIILDLFPLPNRILGHLVDSRLNGRYPRALYDSGKPFPVDHPLGATMMIRREVIEQTGIFDEQFYMYCEEIDWSMRIRHAGWEIYNIPMAHITHLAGKSTGQVRPTSLYNLWASRYRLYTKHYAPLKLILARFLVRIGMQLQIRKAQQLDPAQREPLIAAYRKVIALFTAS